MTRKKHSPARRCGKIGRHKCTECDETKHSVDDCDVLAQRRRHEEKLKKAQPEDSHIHDASDGQDSESD